MRKIIIVLAILFAVNFGYSQSSFKEDVDVVQSIYGKSKSDLMKEYMNLSDSQAVLFAKVYEKYEEERKALGQVKFQLINNYAANYATLTDQKADELAKGILKNNLDYEKLYTKTYSQAKKAIGAINAAKFMQIEVYLQTIIRGEILDSIPFIGELEKTKNQTN
ncbi:hypothetical protein [Flavobacterium sp. HTF]|uniref:hypothetical protein n=1 Tax=Flavobacterium sp. HTF TaxID=2170732 RepID=UPI000D5E4987|nr:hypothetical protein [Flavobacterium sp. HTF]PWB21910.1 hypothetical protein DCO46_18645 [Flavobacterium sp. HTF]